MSHVATPAWRGIAAEDADEVTAALAALLRRRGRRLLADLLRPHRAAVLSILALIITANLAALAAPWLIGVGIDRVAGLVRTGDSAPEIVIVAAFGAAVLAQAAATRAFVAGIGRLGGQVVLDLRQRLFAHFLRLPVSFHERYTTGRVISRQVSDVDAISELFDEGLDSLVSALFSLLLVGTGMLLLDWPLAVIVLAGFGPIYLLSRWFSVQSAVAYRGTRDTIAHVIVQFVETFGGIRAVQAFRREPRNGEIFAELNAGYAAASLRSMRLIAVFFPGVTLVGNLAIAAVLGYGGLRVVDGDVKVGVLVTFVLYLQRFFDPLLDLSQFYSAFLSAAAALEKVSGVLDESPAVAEPQHPVVLPAAASSRGGRAVRLESVRFGYRDAVVLPGLDLDIPAGQTIAVVGATGSGKTTIARLVARFYDPQEGRVLVDGVDLRQLSEPSLRHEIVLITQENFLFSGTVAENIRLGRPGASRDEIEDAGRAIGADSFIAALPAGYDTDVGTRGSRLSAGQRQLISFARAFLAAPAVLVLDEATSLLDMPGERLVQQALRTIMAGRTAIIIAHRLSTVSVADRVLVIESGRIAADGSPADLLTGAGKYADLHQSWLHSMAAEPDPLG